MGAAVDVLSPCALGATLNVDTVPNIKAKVVAGAANNQLSEPAVADQIERRGIVWAPDFVANAGGVINIGVELDGPYDPADARSRVLEIGATLESIFADADKRSITAYAAAMDRARRLIAA